MALTTHFAQVQFRLHQVSEAPEKERDILLKKLEDFADRGIPNWSEHSAEIEAKNIITKMDRQKSHQHELIEQLKTQLEDLEKYAYETGEPVLPQAIMVEKQKIIIDELKQKMNLNFNELDLPQLSPDELRNQVDVAFGEFVSPLKMKEQLVAQLRTQVTDLERFIKYLQIDKNEKKKLLKLQMLQKQNCSEIDLHNKSCDCNFKDTAGSSTAVAANSRLVTFLLQVSSINFLLLVHVMKHFTPRSETLHHLSASAAKFIRCLARLLRFSTSSRCPRWDVQVKTAGTLRRTR